MATLEKFRSYKTLFIQYRRQRFGYLKFAGLSVLIVLLGISDKPEWISLALNFAFIFVTLFVFRWIDDAWSFYPDRMEHPDRTYLLAENIRDFFILGWIIFAFYLFCLFLYSNFLAQTMLILFLISNFLYLLFYRNRSVMLFIPLLKYPVMMWIISNFSISGGVLFLSAGLFFIMLTVDFWHAHPLRKDGMEIKIILLILSGLLVFQPWTSKTNALAEVVFMIIPLFFILLKRVKTFHIFPVVIYPILHIINLLSRL